MSIARIFSPTCEATDAGNVRAHRLLEGFPPALLPHSLPRVAVDAQRPDHRHAAAVLQVLLSFRLPGHLAGPPGHRRRRGLDFRERAADVHLRLLPPGAVRHGAVAAGVPGRLRLAGPRTAGRSDEGRWKAGAAVSGSAVAAAGGVLFRRRLRARRRLHAVQGPVQPAVRGRPGRSRGRLRRGARPDGPVRADADDAGLGLSRGLRRCRGGCAEAVAAAVRLRRRRPGGDGHAPSGGPGAARRRWRDRSSSPATPMERRCRPTCPTAGRTWRGSTGSARVIT